MSGPIGRLAARWNAAAPAMPLAVARIGSGLYALWYVWTRQQMMARISRGDPSLYDPVGPFRVLGHPMDAVAAEWLVTITLVTGVLFTLGWLWRWSGPAFAVALLLTMSYRNSWSMIYHSHDILVLHVLILGFSRAADRLALDAGGRADPGETGDHGWPLRLMCATTAATYFVSGYAKVAGPLGFGWAQGRLMREQIAVDALRKELLEGGGPLAAYDLWDRAWLFTLLGAGTLALELGAPLCLLFRRTRWIWAAATLMMHWGIFVVMDIRFRYQLSGLAFLCFLPLDGWLARAARITGRRRRRAAR